MALPSWPPGLNSRPVRDGYKFSPHDPLARTDMDQGPARQRLVYPNSPATLDIAWPFTADEFEVFRAWHHEDLSDGAAWFWMQVWIGGRQQLGLCQFVGGDYEPVLSGLVWTVSAKLHVRNVEYLSADARWFAGTYGPATALAIAAALHKIIHEEAPVNLPA